MQYGILTEGNEDMAELENEKKEKRTSFFIRLRSTILLIGISALALYFGGWPLALLLLLISICGVFELLRVFGLYKSSLATVTYVFVLLYDLVLYFGQTLLILPCCILYLLVLLTIYVIRYPKHEAKQVTNSFFSFFYVAVCLGYIYQLRMAKDGGLFVVLILLCACGNDIFAYLVGILIGRHKIFPHLSPKKSVEGFFGGIFGAALCGFVYGFIFQHFSEPSPYHFPALFALICGLGAFPAVVGDLVASAIKRNHGIKDYSNLIPGHGGILDRFDSMIFTAPIVYYLVTLLLRKYF